MISCDGNIFDLIFIFIEFLCPFNNNLYQIKFNLRFHPIRWNWRKGHSLSVISRSLCLLKFWKFLSNWTIILIWPRCDVMTAHWLRYGGKDRSVQVGAKKIYYYKIQRYNASSLESRSLSRSSLIPGQNIPPEIFQLTTVGFLPRRREIMTWFRYIVLPADPELILIFSWCGGEKFPPFPRPACFTTQSSRPISLPMVSRPTLWVGASVNLPRHHSFISLDTVYLSIRYIVYS